MMTHQRRREDCASQEFSESPPRQLGGRLKVTAHMGNAYAAQIVNISSSAGSIGIEAKYLRRGGEGVITHAPSMATKQVGYRASKAGLNAGECHSAVYCSVHS